MTLRTSLSESSGDVEVARAAVPLLDLTDLADQTTDAAAADLCAVARRMGVAAVCVWPRFVAGCAAALADSAVRVATVVNFPSGDEPLATVLAQTRTALHDGADEIDVVLPYRAWLAGDDDEAAAVLDGVHELVAAHGARVGKPTAVKVIIESGELADAATIERAATFAIAHGADFVKTSTGKTPVSATPEAAGAILGAIAASGQPVGFKASGGIKTIGDARAYVEIASRVMGSEWITPDSFRFGASSLVSALSTVLASDD